MFFFFVLLQKNQVCMPLGKMEISNQTDTAMKKTILLFVCTMLIALGNNVQSQLVSTRATFSPSNATLIGNESRFGHHENDKSTYYMRYNNDSYFCSIGAFYTTSSMTTSRKIQMPQTSVVTDYQGYIGSYQGVGMHGWTGSYSSYTK